MQQFSTTDNAVNFIDIIGGLQGDLERIFFLIIYLALNPPYGI
jgi:hypothetical protein